MSSELPQVRVGPPATTQVRPGLADRLAVALLSLGGLLATVSGFLSLLGVQSVPRSVGVLLLLNGAASLWCAWRLGIRSGRGWQYFALGSLLFLTSDVLDDMVMSRPWRWPTVAWIVGVVVWGVARAWSQLRQQRNMVSDDQAVSRTDA